MTAQSEAEKRPSDDEILAAVRRFGNRAMTYVVANTLRSRRRPIRTDWVLRQLKRLEKAGCVKRVPTIYAVQICWSVTENPDAE